MVLVEILIGWCVLSMLTAPLIGAYLRRCREYAAPAGGRPARPTTSEPSAASRGATGARRTWRAGVFGVRTRRA